MNSTLRRGPRDIRPRTLLRFKLLVWKRRFREDRNLQGQTRLYEFPLIESQLERRNGLRVPLCCLSNNTRTQSSPRNTKSSHFWAVSFARITGGIPLLRISWLNWVRSLSGPAFLSASERVRSTTESQGSLRICNRDGFENPVIGIDFDDSGSGLKGEAERLGLS